MQQDSDVYVALLDARKAFDSVWHDGLFVKLHEAGCDLRIWSILRHYYRDFQSSVFIAGSSSKWFPVKQGVFQGAPFSMKLYTGFNSDLLNLLQDRGAGVASISISCPAYADDIAILSLHKQSLQSLLDITYQHSCEWRYHFNPLKSCVMRFAKDNRGPTDFVATIGGQHIAAVNHAIHLGVPVSTDCKAMSRLIDDRINRGRRSFHATLSLGSRTVNMTPIILSKLYWAIVIPQMLYGLELIHLKPDMMNRLERAHISMAKRIQGLPTTSATPAALPQLGWHTVKHTLMRRVLLLLWQILLLPMTVPYKQVIIYRILQIHGQHTPVKAMMSPVSFMWESAVQLGLDATIISSIRSGLYMKLTTWKSTIASRINTLEQLEWNASCLLYPSLNLYMQIVADRSTWPWWKYAYQNTVDNRQCKAMLKVATGDYRHRRGDPGQSRNCPHCADWIPDSAPHMLFECSAHNSVRAKSWKLVTDSCPPPFLESMEHMTDRERTVFILSGLRLENFIIEWHIIYKSLLHFVHTMYYAYNSLPM